MTLKSLATPKTSTATDIRDFLRLQARIMPHRHSAEREQIEVEKSARPTILETTLAIRIIAYPTLSRDVKDNLLRKPVRIPSFRKPKHR